VVNPLVDNSGGSAALVQHLLATGRRRIVMVAGPPWLPCARRPVEAYQAVMRSAGLRDRVLPGDFTVAAGHAGALEALRRWPDTDAVFGICDTTAPTLTTATHPVQLIAAAAVTAVLGSSVLPLASAYPSQLVLRESA